MIRKEADGDCEVGQEEDSAVMVTLSNGHRSEWSRSK